MRILCPQPSKNSVFYPCRFSTPEMGSFFVLFCQAAGCAYAVFLDGYFTYFSHGVRYNGFADGKEPPCRVMNGKRLRGAIEP